MIKVGKLSNDYKAHIWGLFFIFFGLAISFMSFQVKDYLEFPKESILLPAAIEFSKDLGFALSSIGLVGIILTFTSWKEYFQVRLGEAVLERNYLNTLDKNKLKDLEIEVFKAFFKVNIDRREDSFLNYFHSTIHKYIASPFRENLNAVVNVEIPKEDNDHYMLHYIISYKCRKMGKYIEKEIRWLEGSEEKVENFKVRFKCPLSYKESCKRKLICQYNHKCKSNESIELKELKELKEGGKGYELDMDSFKKIDGLYIEIEKNIKIKKNKYMAWHMGYPTKNFSFVIHYPDNLSITENNFFGINNKELNISDSQKGIYKIEYDSWLLPSDGIVFLLSEKRI